MKFNDAFWCRVSEFRFRSHLKIRRRPKYEVIGDIYGGCALTIRFEDFEKDKEHLPFDSVEEGLLYAERYEIERSNS